MIHENQYADRSISNEKLKLQTITDAEISASAAISHSKLNISWARPVSSISSLPTNATLGDSRVVLENKHVYVYDGTQWKQETGRESYPIWLWTSQEKIYYLLNNVGIGTDNPSEKLHVHDGAIKLSNSTSSFISKIENTTLNINDFLYITSDNKMGINISSPTKTFEIVGEIKSNSVFTDLVNINTGKIYYEENKLKLESETISLRDDSSTIIDFSNSITVYRDMIISSGANMIFDSDLNPFSSDKNIGSSSLSWSNIYVDRANLESIYFTDTSRISKSVDGIDYNQKFYIQEVVSSRLNFNDEFSLIRTGTNLELKMNTDSDLFSIKNNVEELVRVDKDQVIINKNLVVKGSTTYVESTNTVISDNELVIKRSEVPSDGNAAFVVNREHGDSKVNWDDTSDRWYLTYGPTANIYSKIFTFKDLDSTVLFNSNIGIGVTSLSRFAIQTNANKAIEFLGSDVAKISSTPDLEITSNKISINSSIFRSSSTEYNFELNSRSDKVMRLYREGYLIDKRFEINESFSMFNNLDLELDIKDGRFGIGRISESEKLEIEGNLRLSDKIIFRSNNNKFISLNDSENYIEWKIGQITNKGFEIKDANSDSRLYISPTKGLGINTNNPLYSLHVDGGASFDSGLKQEDFIIRDSTKGSVERVFWYEYASSRLYLGNLNAPTSNAEVYVRGSQFVDKNLGIGKEPGNAKLRVSKPNKYQNSLDVCTDSTKNAIVIDALYENNYNQPGIVWVTTGNNENIPKAAIWTKTSDSGTKLMMGTSKINTYGVSGSTLVVHQDNRVGINNENPVETLDVNGNIKAQTYKSGSTSGLTQNIEFITDVQVVDGVIQKKKKTMTITGGIVTNISIETGWL